MKISLEFPEIKVDEKFIDKLKLQQVFKNECANTVARIKENLDAGKDANGNGLRRYAKSYEEYKKELTGSTIVNLAISGDLRRGMHPILKDPINDEVNIVFEGGGRGRDISNATLAKSLYDRGFTGWFQFGKVDQDRIVKSVKNAVIKNIKSLMKISNKNT